MARLTSSQRETIISRALEQARQSLNRYPTEEEQQVVEEAFSVQYPTYDMDVKEMAQIQEGAQRANRVLSDMITHMNAWLKINFESKIGKRRLSENYSSVPDSVKSLENYADAVKKIIARSKGYLKEVDNDKLLHLITDNLNLADIRQQPSDILANVVSETIAEVYDNPDKFYIK